MSITIGAEKPCADRCRVPARRGQSCRLLQPYASLSGRTFSHVNCKGGGEEGGWLKAGRPGTGSRATGSRSVVCELHLSRLAPCTAAAAKGTQTAGSPLRGGPSGRSGRRPRCGCSCTGGRRGGGGSAFSHKPADHPRAAPPADRPAPRATWLKTNATHSKHSAQPLTGCRHASGPGPYPSCRGGSQRWPGLQRAESGPGGGR